MTTSTEVATVDDKALAVTRGGARSALALSPDQTEWTPAQIAGLRQLGIEDAPEGDLQVFHHVCQRTGLDPFRKQIYMIGRKTKVKRWDQGQRRNVDDWVMKYTIQTGIDGFRRNGREAAAREGEVIRTDGPYWQGADGGGWQDVWLDAKNPPAAAKFVIFRGGEAHVGIAMYSEFVQTNTFDGKSVPNSMWSKMPANQTAKCAEAQAWRRAYPDDFAGIQLEDAMQIIDPDGSPVESVRATTERVSATSALAAGRQAVDAAPADQGTEMATTPEQRRLSAQLDRHGLRDAGDKLGWLAKRLGREIASAKELTGEEARGIIARLSGREAGDMPILATQWTEAAALLDRLGADGDDKKLMFLRNYLQRDEIADPLDLNEREAAEVLAELNQLVAEDAARGDAGADQ